MPEPFEAPVSIYRTYARNSSSILRGNRPSYASGIRKHHVMLLQVEMVLMAFSIKPWLSEVAPVCVAYLQLQYTETVSHKPTFSTTPMCINPSRKREPPSKTMRFVVCSGCRGLLFSSLSTSQAFKQSTSCNQGLPWQRSGTRSTSYGKPRYQSAKLALGDQRV